MATSLNPELISKNKNEIEDVRVKIQQDYARVDIYYQTLNLKSIKQSPTISVCIQNIYQKHSYGSKQLPNAVH